MKKRIVSYLRYWCQSELLLHGQSYDEVWQFCLDYLDRIAINNPSLVQYYRPLGFCNIIYLENWIRGDLFNCDITKKEPYSIGHQPDGEQDTVALLRSRYGEDKVILCVGDQRQVSEKMKAADFFVFWN